VYNVENLGHLCLLEVFASTFVGTRPIRLLVLVVSWVIRV